MPRKKTLGRSERKKAPAKPKKGTSTAIFVPPRKLAQQRSKALKKSGVRRVSAPARPKRR